jgi:cytoskeletal protein CcmA (bactofilin family)
MFGKKRGNATIDSLIGSGTLIEGDVRFRGGLRIDGEVRGSVHADGDGGVLVLSEHGRIEGEVRAATLLINGEVVGPVIADELVELQPKARVRGQIRYRAMEIHQGALVEGGLAHLEDERPGLKLAASNE